MEQFEMTEPWSSVDGVVKHLGMSIYRSSEARALPAHKIGRLWKLKLSEVAEWVSAEDADGGETPASKKAPRANRRPS